MAARDEYPPADVDVSTVNLQEPAPVGRKKPGPVEVQAGPFATFLDKSAAFSMQKYIVPWCIARYGLSFPKELSLESVQEMLIAIIDAE